MDKFEYRNEMIPGPEYSSLVTDMLNRWGEDGWEVIGIFGIDRMETDGELDRRDLYLSQLRDNSVAQRQKIRETRLILKRKVV